MSNRASDEITRTCLRLQLLDRFALCDGTEELCVPLVGQRLLAYVALHRSVTRARVAEALWPDADEEHAQANLRTTLWRVSGAQALTTGSGALRLRSGVVVDVDVLTQNARLLATATAVERLDQLPVVPLSGDLLPGWYDEWLVAPRERLRQVHLHALEGLGEQYLHRGWYGSALETALAAAEVEPLRESAQQLIMRVHVAEGNVVEAVRTFEALRDLLWRNLGVRPSERTRAVLASASAAPDRAPAPRVERTG